MILHKYLSLVLSIQIFEVDQPEVHKSKKAWLEYDLNLTDEQKEEITLIPLSVLLNKNLFSKVGQHQVSTPNSKWVQKLSFSRKGCLNIFQTNQQLRP